MNVKEILQWIVLAWFIVGVIVFFVALITSFVFLVMAAGHGDRHNMPSHMKFNPLNVILYANSLTDTGKKFRKTGLKFLMIAILAFAGQIPIWLIVALSPR